MHIKQLVLKTGSLQKTRLFYSKTLELEIVNETDESISFQAGKTILTFEETKGEKPIYHFAFNIVNNKFSDSYEWINQKLDIIPAAEDMIVAGYDDWNAQAFYFTDNNHNILEFITRFDLPYYSAEPFSPACITELSEIGLVTGNVQQLADEIKAKHNIPFFAKGPVLNDFIAMGDDYGLLLIVQNKKGWIPTNKPAATYPVTVITGDDHTISIS